MSVLLVFDGVPHSLVVQVELAPGCWVVDDRADERLDAALGEDVLEDGLDARQVLQHEQRAMINKVHNGVRISFESHAFTKRINSMPHALLITKEAKEELVICRNDECDVDFFQNGKESCKYQRSCPCKLKDIK